MFNHLDAGELFISATEAQLNARPHTYAWKFATQVRDEMSWQWMRQLFAIAEQQGGRRPSERKVELSFDIEWSRN